MPRAPKFIHPLRIVRKEMGNFSQPRFGAMIGCSASTIQAVENGQLKLSLRLAHRIQLHTGAQSHELIKGRRGKAVDFMNKPFSKQSYENWKWFFVEPQIAGVKKHLSNLTEGLATLLNAAQKRRRLVTVVMATTEALRDIANHFDLRLGNSWIAIGAPAKTELRPRPGSSM